MNKGLAKIAALVMAAVMLTFAGCGNGGGTGNAPNRNEKGFPEELAIWGGMGGNLTQAGGNENNDMLGFQLMEELTGTHINWTHPAQGAAQEKFNLMIASESFPDIIVYGWSGVPGGARLYAEDEIILSLKDLVAKNMPNLTAYLNANPEIKKQIINDEGEIYYIPYIRGDKRLNVFQGPQIRKDWLDRLGLETPRTPDDLYTVLKAFKTLGPDIIPMSGVGFEDIAYGVGNLSWAFGTHYGYYLDNGKIKYGIMEERFGDALEYIRKLYDEGLIDPDFLINDRSKMDAKVINDRVGFLYSMQPTRFMNEMNDGVRRIAGIPHLSGLYGDEMCFNPAYTNSVLDAAAAVTTICEDPDGALKWLDQFYGEPGLTIANFGKEGLTYEMADGEPRLTDYLLKNPDGKTQGQMLAGNIIAFDSAFPMIQDWRYYEQYLSQWGREAIDTWAENADTKGILPVLLFNDKESERIAEVKTQIDTYVSEAINRIITGSEKLENLSAIRTRVKELGIDEIIQIYTNAYERYQKR